MATITAIKQQVKHPDLFSVFVDGSFQLSLTALELSKAGLASGQSLNDQELEALQAKARYGKCLQAAYNLLSYRSRSQKELAQRLKRKGFEDPVVDQVMARLIELNLIDDEAFAVAWMTKSTTKSQRRLALELQQKGIKAANVTPTDQDRDIEAIRTLVSKKIAKSTPVKQKLIEYLIRQGFSYNQIQRVLIEDFSEVDWQQSSGRPSPMTTTTTRLTP